MSRFATIIKNQNLTVEASEIEAMTAASSPEGQPGAVFIKNFVALGSSDRPVINEKKTMAIVFDGVLTGSKALKEELGLCADATDTETVLRACELWDIEGTLKRLDGAFAFTLYDFRFDVVYIARDRLGIKPLYYFRDHTGLYAASTMRMLTKTAFPKIISRDGLNLFLSLNYIPAPHTIYENILKLLPGHFLLTIGDGTLIHPYYRPEDHINPKGLTFDQAKEKLKELLTDSVKTLLEGNDAAGAFLSGGLDSSIVAGIMSKLTQKPVRTFSIGFKEKEHDETDRALLASEAFGTNHTLHYLTYPDIMDVLDDIIDYFDEPFGDSSAIPTYYVSKLASKQLKTVFTGDCADELFGGYNRYLSAYWMYFYLLVPKPVRYLIEKAVRLIPRKAEKRPWIRKMKKFVAGASVSESQSKSEIQYQSMCLSINDIERRQLIKSAFYTKNQPTIESPHYRYYFKSDFQFSLHNRKEGTRQFRHDSVNNAMFIDICLLLEGNMLPKMERMCMMNSLTALSPFSSDKIVNFALSLPATYKVKGRKKKRILREAFKDLLPETISTVGKHGFTAPVAHWLRKELKQDLLNLLDREVVEKQGLFNVDTVTCLVEQHMSGEFDHSQALWNLLVFQKWYAKNVNT